VRMRWSLLRRFTERLTRARPEQEKAPSSEGHWSDQEILTEDQDRFSFQDYANVLAGRAATADTPLTIGIFGRWGSGKTSLMRLIEAALPRGTTKGGRLRSTWINVWQLSNQDEVWHAFLQAIFSKVHGKLSLWRRVDKRKLLRQLASNSYRIVLVITPMIVGLLIAKPEAGWGDVLSLVLNPIAGGGTLVTVGLGLWTLAKPIIEAARETVSFDLQAVLKYAPYEAQITELMQLQERFKDMVGVLVGEHGRLVVFIDDLDRCTPDKVPEVLEAIKLFTTTPRCVYVLGLDHDIARQGIKTKYKFETEAAATEYLEKIVQIPFHLPPLDESRIETFIQEYYPDLHEVCPTAPDVFSQGLEPNPRKVKRALNIYRTLLDLAEVRVRAWEMDPVEPELVAKIIVIQSRFRALHEDLVRHPTFLLKVEEKALADGLDDESLAGDEEVGWVLIGKPETKDSEAKPGLIEVSGLRALDDMLHAGERHFNDDDQRDQISTYIYLIATTEGAAEQVRPNRREREALLGGDRAQIEAQVDEILERGVDEPARQRIGQTYIERLEGVLSDPDRYTPAEAESASIALPLLEVSLLGETWDSIQARLDEILYTEPAPAQVAVKSMAQQTMLADGTPFREESQEAKQQLRRRLQSVLDGSGWYDTPQMLTANMVLDLLEGWERQDFEPQTVHVPAGPFLMGSSAEQVRQVIADGLGRDFARREQPQHSVELGTYRIGRYPLTNAEYQAFVQATGHQPPEHWDGESYPEGKDDHPVVNVSWHDAVAYCQWLNEKTGQAYRLPTEAEWEKAARGTDGRIYPWGNEWDETKLNSAEGGPGDTTPVGQYSPGGDSPYGTADMAGNVWEWIQSVYKDYPYDPEDGREDLEAEGPRVLRGGAFYFNRGYVRCAARFRDSPDDFLRDYGFRVVVAPGSSLDSGISGL
jgi:formylglycine-generating enzyme required for sulfatase activity